jgi:2-oxoglutarate ferredoxin oxidoreductase subunit delta
LARSRGSIAVEAERCTGCDICVVLCPPRCLELGDDVNAHGYPVVVLARPQDCTGCEICGHVCPHWAIEVFRERDVEEHA